MKRSFTQVVILVCILLRVVLLSSCANILPPSGGPRDSLPPRLVMAIPKDSSLNVNTKNITLTFDEYVTLQNPLENLIISPLMKQFPLVDYKLKNVTIKLKDSLEANTTYSFNFGEAIRDVNESNIARGFTYVFSTGKTIDYNTYSGKVLVAETGKSDSTLIVVLHKDLSDSSVIKNPPRYYTRLNGKGEFTFHNLPEGVFTVYVIPGTSYSRKYEDTTKLFAFRNTPVKVGSTTQRDTLYAFAQSKPAPIKTSATSSSPVAISAANRDDKRLRYTRDLDNGQQDLLSNLTLTFNRKLFGFDSTKFVLYDSNYNKLSGYSFLLDSTKTKVIVQYKWKEASYLRLLIAKDAVADSLGVTLPKADTIRFNTKKETDYGSVHIRFTGLDLSKNPVLQILQSDKLLESVPLTGPDFTRKLFKPGSYELRILYDINKNGVWDTGRFTHGKRQPEIVYLIPKQLAIRANWDNDVTIGL